MFKKIIAKFILVSLVSMTISLVMPTTYADKADKEPETKLDPMIKTLSESLNDAENTPCIQEVILKDNKENGLEKGAKGPDAGYIITIIEEPLNPKPIGKTGIGDNGDDYASRICYRNYFAYTGAKKKNENVSSELSTMCSETAAEAVQNKNLQQKYNIKFTCQQVQVLLTRGGTSTIEAYINIIYRWAASVIGLIAVAVIIFSAMQISFAGGDSTGVDEAKKRILQSLLAIALLFLSGVILNFVNPTFFIK